MSRLPRACTWKHLWDSSTRSRSRAVRRLACAARMPLHFPGPGTLVHAVVIEIKSRFAGRRSLCESIDDQVDNFVQRRHWFLQLYRFPLTQYQRLDYRASIPKTPKNGDDFFNTPICYRQLRRPDGLLPTSRHSLWIYLLQLRCQRLLQQHTRPMQSHLHI